MNLVLLRAFMDANAVIFGALNDADAAIEFMANDKSHDLPAMSGKQVKDAFNGEAAEWNAIGPEGRSEILSLVARDDLAPHGVDAEIFQQSIGVNAPNTLAVLNAARTITTSTAFIEGFGEVQAIDVFRARALG